MAHIRMRSSSSYTITIYLGRKENGSKRCYYETFYGTFKEVKKRAKQLELELKSKPKGIPKKHLLKVNELLNRWLDLKQRKVAPETYKKYFWLVKKLDLAVGDFPAYTFDPWEVEQRLGEFKVYSVRTQVDLYNTLKSALNLIARDDESLKEVINGFEPPKIREFKKTKITKNDLRKFIDIAKNDRNYLILRFIALGGFRISEVLALKWKDINFTEGCINISRAISIKTGEIKNEIRDASIRSLELDAITIEELHKRESSKLTEDDFIFKDDNGALPSYSSIRRAMQKIFKICDLNISSTNDLRYALESILLSEGVSVPVVAVTLGKRNQSIDTFTWKRGKCLSQIIKWRKNEELRWRL